MLTPRLPRTAMYLATAIAPSRWAQFPTFLQIRPRINLEIQRLGPTSLTQKASARCFSSSSSSDTSTACPPLPISLEDEESSRRGPLESGLYMVATPIGNLEDITLRAIRVLKSANLILCEDTRHSGKLLQHYGIKTPLLSYHKFNESQRGETVLRRLKRGEVIALISDAGTPGYSDPGGQLVKLCVDDGVPVIPIPGPCAAAAALCASGLPIDEFTFVGFLPKHAGSRRERLTTSANEPRTQLFYVPPHKLSQFLEETSSFFGNSRRCVLAREITKLHEEFWRGTLGEAREAFLSHKPKGEITLLIEGKANLPPEIPSESQLQDDLRDLISAGHSLSEAVKLVAHGSSLRRKLVYSLALQKFGKQQVDGDSD